MDVMGQELEVLREMLREDYPEWSDQDIRKASMKLIKMRWKKDDGEWSARAGLAAEMPIGDFYKLQKIRPYLAEEPDMTEQQNYALAAFQKFPHNFSLVAKAEVVEEVSLPSLSSIITGKEKESTVKNDRPNDFVLMKSTLCTSLPFVNANGDAFEAEDLVEAVESGQLDKLQPAIVDWRHDFMSYGNTVGAEIVEKNLEIDGFGKNKVKQIVVYSVFYAWLHNYKAKKIRDWAKKGVLTFSMACGAESQEFRNGSAVRVLRKPHFVANSIIPPDLDPADENATLVEMAGKNDNVPVVYASYNEYPETVKENLTLAWLEDSNENPDEENNIGVDMDKIKELETKIAQLTDDLAKANDKIAVYEQTESAQKIVELEGKVETLTEDLRVANEALEAAKSDLEASNSEKDSLNNDLTAAKDEIKEMRKNEVDGINQARKEKLASIFGEDTEKADYWYAKYEASLDDDGNIVDNEEDFEATIAAFPEAEKADDADEDNKDDADVSDDTAQADIGDVDESEKVKRSKKVDAVATKVDESDTKKRAFSKTM